MPTRISNRIIFCVNIEFTILFFSSFHGKADDGQFSTTCKVNITIRDVNNHAPQFIEANYSLSIAENTPIGIEKNGKLFFMFLILYDIHLMMFQFNFPSIK